MADPSNLPRAGGSEPQFFSDCDIIRIREEDTVPSKPSEQYMRWLQEKYGRKRPPRDEAASVDDA